MCVVPVSEGHACRAHGNGMDCQTVFGGRDNRVPSIFVFGGAVCRRDPLVGSAAQRWNIRSLRQARQACPSET